MKCEVKHNGDMGIYGLMGGGAMLKKTGNYWKSNLELQAWALDAPTTELGPVVRYTFSNIPLYIPPITHLKLNGFNKSI